MPTLPSWILSMRMMASDGTAVHFESNLVRSCKQQPASERAPERQPYGQGLDRLEVHVHHPFRRFPRQAAFLEVVDLVVLRIQEVEDIELEAVSVVEAIAKRRIHDLHAMRPNAVVLDQRRRPEEAEVGGAEPAGLLAAVDACSCDDIRGSRNTVSCRIEIREARM